MKEKANTGKWEAKSKGMLHLVKPGEVPLTGRAGDTTRVAKSEKSMKLAERTAPGDKLAYNVREAAEALGVSPWYVRDEMSRGRLGYSSARGRKIIPRWELVRYLEAYMQESGGGGSLSPGTPAGRKERSDSGKSMNFRKNDGSCE